MFPDARWAEPPIPKPSGHDHWLRPAVVVSLLLHAGLAVAFARVAPSPEPLKTVESTPAIRVAIATSSPQRRSARSSTDSTDDQFSNAPTESKTPARMAESPRVDNESAPIADAGPASGPIDEQDVILDIARLQNSIRGSASTYRSYALEHDMLECRKYRERYSRWDCPQREEVTSPTQELINDNMDAIFRTWTWGHDRNARLSAELLADMEAMRPLMGDDGVLGTLARERYYLNTVRYANLNPQGGSREVATILTFSLGGINLLNGLLTIRPNGKVKVLDDGPAVSFEDDGEE